MTIFSLPTFSYTPTPSPLLHTLGARVGVPPPPPLGAFLLHVGALLLRFSPYGELILPCGGVFGTFFSLWETFFTMWGSFFSIRVFFVFILGFSLIFLHVGAFWLRFHLYWDLFLPCDGLHGIMKLYIDKP